METEPNVTPTELAAGDILRICNASVQRIAVVHGMVWVTQEADQRDIFLSDREDFVLERPGTALVEAITDTHLLLFVGAAAELIRPPYRRREARRPTLVLPTHPST